MSRKKNHFVIAYLDDFLLIGQALSECAAAQNFSLFALLTRLEFTVYWSKVIRSVERIQYLGLTIDSILQRLELQ